MGTAAERNNSIAQKVAILIDGNNIELSIHKMMQSKKAMLNFDELVPKFLNGRALNRFVYFKEGDQISSKFKERIQQNFAGSVIPCRKTADISICIEAIKIIPKVDTIILFSGDADFIPLINYLKHNGIRVECAGLEHSASFSLISQVDCFHKIKTEDCFIYESYPKVKLKKGLITIKRKTEKLGE